ncbi:hypothetical protein EVAR_40920_1 [Eumeta japonica]|uniref:Uncharacterized protein n=1 Tax=Eumeta variegata TaxID=151549 RepID=A0A4C1X642_EUMVA|nr:hypothetical protein EVAR_40920_1 [Eumeta japonica]
MNLEDLSVCNIEGAFAKESAVGSSLIDEVPPYSTGRPEQARRLPPAAAGRRAVPTNSMALHSTREAAHDVTD